MVKQKADKIFLFLVFCLIVVGFTIFISASQGLLGRNSGADFFGVAIKQLGILLLGLLVLIVFSHVPYRSLQRWAFWLFVLAVILNLLVFIPKLGFSAGGARRWLLLGPFSFQPSELLKFGFVIYLAYWLSAEKAKVQNFTRGLLPFVIITLIPTIILLKEPDIGTFTVLFAAGVAMYFVAGGKWRHFLLLILSCVLAVGILAIYKPYVRDRIATYLNPQSDTLGSSYQINQAMIAVGSGGWRGRGFGQSIQKFNFLPEAIGDSVFAVAAEEFGFIGSVFLVILFSAFALWGIKISSKINDSFGRLLVLGIVILITAQSFINISSMLGLIPLTGVPLIFVSQGGSALLVALLEIGIVLNISKYQGGRQKLS
ncbi:MAG: putative peptidoglycan glycosyltransferase FtsW [Patescibacteria group bacterium]